MEAVPPPESGCCVSPFYDAVIAAILLIVVSLFLARLCRTPLVPLAIIHAVTVTIKIN